MYGKVTGISLGGPASWLGQGVRNHQNEVSRVSQVNRDSDMVLPADSVLGGLSKGTMASAGTSVWEKAVLLTLPTPKSDSSVSPWMSLVPFQLLLQHGMDTGISSTIAYFCVCSIFQ